MATNVDLNESFYDDVAVPCPRCDGLDVTVYAFTNDQFEFVVEAVCGECQSKWSMS